MQAVRIHNGKLVLPNIITEGVDLYLRNGKIEAITNVRLDNHDLVEIDARGNYVAPGFIDMHVHGGGNYDFMDNDLQGYFEIARVHAMHGTTAMSPTTLSCEKQDLLQTITLYDQASKMQHDGAKFIGLHIEGPYFAMTQRGAQDPRYIRNPDREEYEEILSTTKNIIRWSAAPELPGALEFGKYMKAHNIIPAIAHTDAIYEEVEKALDAGFTHITHFYSAMSGVFRKNAFRYAGVIESGYLLDELTVEIIADGVHLPPPLLKLVYKLKGPDKTALITDAMRAAGVTCAQSVLGSRKNGLTVIVEDGVAKLPDRSAFAGSVATTDLLVRNMATLAGVPLIDAVKMATITPARLLKIEEKKGSLKEGKDADVVIFDKEINILTTIVEGQIVYCADSYRE